jgi:predicted kinase
VIYLSERDLPIFIMTVGLSGAGKTPFVHSPEMKDFAIVCPDDIRKELTGDISDQSQNAKVWFLAKQRVIDALNSGRNVILDATNLDSNQRKNFIKDFPPVQLKAKIFHVEPEEAIRRIHKSLEEGKDRAKTPNSVIYKMYEKFKTQSTPEKLKEEGFELI